MIHLYRLIKQLRKLIETNSSTDEIAAKDSEIRKACQRLIEEHGSSDVSERIQTIHRAVNRMQMATGGRMSLGNSGAFDYQIAMTDVELMEEEIREIGKILRIEFKETQS